MPAMAPLPQFVDGRKAAQGDLNAQSTGIDTLTQITTGKTAASRVSSKPVGHWFLNANVNLVSGSFVPISWTAEGYDTDNVWTNATPTVLRIATPGKYVFSAQAFFNPNATGARSLRFFLNGTNPATNTVAAYQVPLTGAANDCVIQLETYPIPLTTNDTIVAAAFQNSGVALALRGAVLPTTIGGGTWLSMEWIAPL